MSNLGPQAQNASFPGLLQVPGGITSSLQVVTDGSGNATGLSLSATAVSVSGLVSSTAQNIYGGTAGALPYQTALSTTAFVTPGITGQFLKSNGTAAPTFATITASTVGALPTSGGTLTGVLDLSSNLIQNVATPVASTDAATKGYVDSIATGLQPKAAVTCASTTNISSLSGLLTIDGVTVTSGQRVLVKDQSTPANNGIYVASASAWSRSTDADTWSELVGASVFVSSGSLNANTSWVTNIASSGTLGVTPVTFVQFGAASSYTAGTGLTLAGNQFSLTSPVSAALGGTGISGSITGIPYANASSAMTLATGAQLGYQLAGTGTTGQFLKSNASSAPSWSSDAVLNSIVLNGAASGSITFSAPSAAGSQSYTLPTAIPSVNGQILSSTTTGAMSWITPSPIVINVADYGASSSASAATNTAAIQAAINAAPAQGATIVFPPASGNYNINGTINLNKQNITINGQGATIHPTTNVTTIYITAWYCNIVNIKIVGTGTTFTSATYAIDTGYITPAAQAAQYLKIDNVSISDVGSGMRMRSAYFWINRCAVEFCVANSGEGIRVEGVTDTGNYDVDSIGFISDTLVNSYQTSGARMAACVVWTSGNSVQISNCSFIGAINCMVMNPYGTYLHSCRVSNTYFDSPGNAGLYVANVSSKPIYNSTFNGCWFGNAVNYGILTEAGAVIKSFVLNGCEFMGAIECLVFGAGDTLANVIINACSFSGTTTGISLGSSTKNYVITGNSIGQTIAAGPTYPIYFNAGVDGIVVSGNRFNASLAGSVPSNGTTVQIGNNIFVSP